MKRYYILCLKTPLVYHKFGIDESKELIKDFQDETHTFIDPVKQLAEMLGIGITLAYRLVKQNTIKSIKVGRQYKIPKQNIISYLLSQNVV